MSPTGESKHYRYGMKNYVGWQGRKIKRDKDEGNNEGGEGNGRREGERAGGREEWILR